MTPSLLLVGLFLPGCASSTGATAKTDSPPASNIDALDRIVYNLPKTQIRISGTITAKITDVKVDPKQGESPYTYELSWGTTKVTTEPIPDEDHYYSVPTGKSGFLASKSFGMSLTPEGFPTDGSATTKDRVVPLITSVLKIASNVVALGWMPGFRNTSGELSSLNLDTPREDRSEALKKERQRLRDIFDDRTAKREKHKQLKNRLQDSPLTQDMTLDEAKRVAAVHALIESQIESLAADITRLSAQLESETKIEHVFVPENHVDKDGTQSEQITCSKTLPLHTLAVTKEEVGENLEFVISGHRTAKIQSIKTGAATTDALVYRVPFVGSLEIKIGKESVVEEIPITVNQLGWVRSLTTDAGLFKNKAVAISYHGATGGLSKFSNDLTGGTTAGAEAIMAQLQTLQKAKDDHEAATSEFARLKAETEMLELRARRKKAEEALGVGP